MEKKMDSFFLSHKKDKKQAREKNKNGENQLKRQEEFNKNRKGLEDVQQKSDNKPFDKKTYRLKKYSKKYKLDQWEEQRKKKLLRDYYKDVKNDPLPGAYKPVSFDEDITDSNEAGKYVRHPDLIVKPDEPKTKKAAFQKAQDHYNKIKQDKLEKQKEIEKTKEERKEKLLQYKKKKQERFKKLSKKNKKGQPAMSGRLEMLLEKIQKG